MSPRHEPQDALGAPTPFDSSTRQTELHRRAFLAACSSLGLGGTLLPGVLWARLQEQGDEEPTLSKETIAEAEKVAGLELTDEERELMRRGLDRNLGSFRALRELEIPNEVPPALLFEPEMPGVEVSDDAAPSSPLRWTGRAGPRPEAPDDLAFAAVSELADLVRRREVSSEELTTLYLERLRRYDEKLLAVVHFTEKRALAQARQADREIGAGGYRGPLHGVPWGAKDLLAVRGYPTTWGAAPYRDQQIDADATVVQRLDRAGAVLVAKLSLGALAMGDVWYGGRTRSPWNTERGSSGSSAGPGAATAAGCVGFGIGTETRGSIVSPSTRNANSSLRPTFGRVSRAGAMALSWSMDKIGPMCRNAEDCALVFSAIHGADGIDPSARTRPFDWDPYRDPRSLRVGVLERAFEEDAEEEGYRGREHDLETLRVLREELGLELRAVDLPDFPIDAVGFMLTAEAAAAFDLLTRSGRDDLLTRQDAFAWPTTFRTARLIPAVEYLQASRARTIYMRLLSEAWRDVDVVVAPTFRLGIVGATNLTGHPCAVVPNGFGQDGMPSSISFLAGLYREADALLLAHAYQRATDFHRRRPDLEAQPVPKPPAGPPA